MPEPRSDATAEVDTIVGTSDTVVFIPAWNEEENLPAVLEELDRELPGVDVIVIDDGSTDATAALAHDRRAVVVSFGENLGLRAAIAAGYREAGARGYAYCGRVDADGQHPVRELRRLLESVTSGACDVAIGSRFAVDGEHAEERYRPSPGRRFGIGLLRRAMRVRLGRRFDDPTSGLIAANAAAMTLLAEPYSSGAPEVEALLRLREAGLRVEEIAVDMRPRSGGESKLQGRKAVTLVATVIATLVLFDARRRRRP